MRLIVIDTDEDKKYRLKHTNFLMDWNWFFILPTINVLFKQEAVLLHWLGFHLAISKYLRAELKEEINANNNTND